MTEVYADAADIMTCITELTPVPRDNVFKRAFWLSKTAESLSVVLKAFEFEYMAALEAIIDAGLTDSVYEVTALTKVEHEVNLEKLRLKYPRLYEECAYVDADTAMEIFGKKKLRDLVIASVGADKIYQYDSVTIESIKDLDGKLRAEDCVSVLHVPNGYRIREKEGAVHGS